MHREAASGSSPTVGMFSLGLLFALSAATASGLLAAQHVWRVLLPGCGPGSACDKAAQSVFGKLPGLNWPVSFLGLAFFVAMAAAWTAVFLRRAGVPATMRWMTRLGAAVSLFYVGVMIANSADYLCKYCIASHIANFLFAGVVEFAGRSRDPAAARSLRPAAVAAAMFALVSAALGLADFAVRSSAREKAEAQLKDSTAQMAQQSSVAPAPAVEGSGTRAAPAPAAVDYSRKVFTGRHRRGPEQAAVRIVIFMDYQCGDCRRKEAEIEAVLKAHPNVSFSPMFFPMNADCNPLVPEFDKRHMNACWAARAAEAASILHGEEGFWKMHDWLIAKGGSFTDAELAEGLAQLGFEYTRFVQVMQSPQTLERVREDVAFAEAVGLQQTPMIFVNGVELRGWSAEDAVGRAVRFLLGQNPPPAVAGPEVDRPPLANEKFMEDWRRARVFIPPGAGRWARGPDNARIEIVLYGDLHQDLTMVAYAELQKFMAGRNDVRFVFRHFPLHEECNIFAELYKDVLSCTAARALEAAGALLGAEGFWTFFDRTIANQASVSDQFYNALALEMGIPLEQFVLRTQPKNQETMALIHSDCETLAGFGLRGAPYIFVQGKLVANWRTPSGYLLIHDVLREADAQAPR